jgi:hypothetical protein
LKEKKKIMMLATSPTKGFLREFEWIGREEGGDGLESFSYTIFDQNMYLIKPKSTSFGFSYTIFDQNHSKEFEAYLTHQTCISFFFLNPH